jgi:hypothetical protein
MARGAWVSDGEAAYLALAGDSSAYARQSVRVVRILYRPNRQASPIYL